MMKKFIVCLLICIFAFPVYAKPKANLFAYSREAPDTVIYDLTGNPLQINNLKGDFLLIVFWSKNCIPCLREMEDLNNLSNKLKGSNIRIIMVSPQKEWGGDLAHQEILRKYGGEDLDFYLDKDSALANQFGIYTSPHTVLINTEGMEIGRIRGAIDWDDSDTLEYIYKIKAQY